MVAYVHQLSRYREAGLATAVTHHAQWLATAACEVRATPRQAGPVSSPRAARSDDWDERFRLREKYGAAFLRAYLTLARVLEQEGGVAEAIRQLELGESRLPDARGAGDALRKEIARLRGR